MSYHRSGPSPLLIVLVGALFVFGGYYIWTGFLGFLEDQGDIMAPATRQAVTTSTAAAAPQRPTVFMPASFTPLPPCLDFQVRVERAVYRACPSQNNDDCPRLDSMVYGDPVCVYAPATENPEWYVVELNPGGAFRDIVYMHESVLEAVNPTPTPSLTFTPLPTVSPVPSDTPLPTVPVTPTETPDPEVTPTPTPMLTPSPLPPQITI